MARQFDNLVKFIKDKTVGETREVLSAVTALNESGLPGELQGVMKNYGFVCDKCGFDKCICSEKKLTERTCKNFKKDDGTCRTGCAKLGKAEGWPGYPKMDAVAKGDVCPFVMDDQDTCPCFEKVEIQEKKLTEKVCKNYKKDDETCRVGCSGLDVAKGATCPFDVGDQDECECFERVGVREKRKINEQRRPKFAVEIGEPRIVKDMASKMDGAIKRTEKSIAAEEKEKEPDKDLIKMFKNDLKDYQAVKDAIAKGDGKKAQKIVYDMDTAAVDDIPTSILRALDLVESKQIKEGEATDKAAAEAQTEAKFTVTPELIDDLITELQVDTATVDKEQFTRGVEVEQEHASLINDPKVIAQIALDHLKEISDYYTRLDAMEAAATAEKPAAPAEAPAEAPKEEAPAEPPKEELPPVESKVAEGKMPDPKAQDADKIKDLLESTEEAFLKEYVEMAKDEAFVKEHINEVAPEGWEPTVKAMKKHKEITNPWALAWYMKGKGYKPSECVEAKVEEAEKLLVNVSDEMIAKDIAGKYPGSRMEKTSDGKFNIFVKESKDKKDVKEEEKKAKEKEAKEKKEKEEKEAKEKKEKKEVKEADASAVAKASTTTPDKEKDKPAEVGEVASKKEMLIDTTKVTEADAASVAKASTTTPDKEKDKPAEVGDVESKKEAVKEGNEKLTTTVERYVLASYLAAKVLKENYKLTESERAFVSNFETERKALTADEMKLVTEMAQQLLKQGVLEKQVTK